MVADMLGGAELVEVSSDGEPGDKSRFVRAVEQAVLDGRADIGVHSAKDLPGEEVEGLEIAAVPPREDPADAWIGAGTSLEDAPEGARVGTASLRRKAQLLAVRPDLRVLDLNGNVDTRLRKLAEGDYDAIILAAAGLRRLGREDEIGFRAPRGPDGPGGGPGRAGAAGADRRRGERRGGAGDRRGRALRRAARRARLLHPPGGRLLDPDRRPRRSATARCCGSAPSSACPTAASGSATSSTPTPAIPRRPAASWRSACSAPAPPSSWCAPRSRQVDGPKSPYILVFGPSTWRARERAGGSSISSGRGRGTRG